MLAVLIFQTVSGLSRKAFSSGCGRGALERRPGPQVALPSTRCLPYDQGDRDLLALIAAVAGDYATDPNYTRLVAAFSSQTNV